MRSSNVIVIVIVIVIVCLFFVRFDDSSRKDINVNILVLGLMSSFIVFFFRRNVS